MSSTPVLPDFDIRTDRRVRRVSLCARCARHDHSRQHTALGCITPVLSAPNDWICKCLVGQTTLPGLTDTARMEEG